MKLLILIFLFFVSNRTLANTIEAEFREAKKAHYKHLQQKKKAWYARQAAREVYLQESAKYYEEREEMRRKYVEETYGKIERVPASVISDYQAHREERRRRYLEREKTRLEFLAQTGKYYEAREKMERSPATRKIEKLESALERD